MNANYSQNTYLRKSAVYIKLSVLSAKNITFNSMFPNQAMTFEEKVLSCRALMKYCENVSKTSSSHLFTTTPTPHFMNTL